MFSFVPAFVGGIACLVTLENTLAIYILQNTHVAPMFYGTPKTEKKTSVLCNYLQEKNSLLKPQGHCSSHKSENFEISSQSTRDASQTYSAFSHGYSSPAHGDN